MKFVLSIQQLTLTFHRCQLHHQSAPEPGQLRSTPPFNAPGVRYPPGAMSFLTLYYKTGTLYIALTGMCRVIHDGEARGPL